MDNQVGAIHSLDNCDLEIKQINHQKKIHLTEDESDEIHWYGRNGFKKLNGYLNQTEDFVNDFNLMNSERQSEIVEDAKEMIEYLDSAMDKSLGLVENTKLFRYDYFDVNLNPGDKGI